MSYNPFDKAIGEKLDETDLSLLVSRRVSEGFYVEFKRELPKDRAKIAHSLASFANAHGGWYVVGIDADEHNIARAVCGFAPDNGHHDPLSVITETVKVGIQPALLLFQQVVSLSSGRLAVVVYVPGDQAAPFVTKDGRIYRRISDSSSPVAENNRHALDELVQRGHKHAERFKQFAGDDWGIDEKRDTAARICLAVSPYPFNAVPHRGVVRQETAEKLLAESVAPIPLGEGDDPLKGVTGHVPFDTVLVKKECIILRQIPKGSEPYHGLSMQLDVSGRCKISFRLPKTITLENWREKIVHRECQDYMVNRFFSDEAGVAAFEELKFFDIAEVWMVVTALSAFYRKWLGDSPILDGYDASAEAVAVSQYVPFFDNPNWAQHVQKYGLPVTLHHRSRAPEYTQGGWEIPKDELLRYHLCVLVGAAFGLPAEFTIYGFREALADGKVDRWKKK